MIYSSSDIYSSFACNMYVANAQTETIGNPVLTIFDEFSTLLLVTRNLYVWLDQCFEQFSAKYEALNSTKATFQIFVRFQIFWSGWVFKQSLACCLTCVMRRSDVVSSHASNFHFWINSTLVSVVSNVVSTRFFQHLISIQVFCHMILNSEIQSRFIQSLLAIQCICDFLRLFFLDSTSTPVTLPSHQVCRIGDWLTRSAASHLRLEIDFYWMPRVDFLFSKLSVN